MGLLQPISARLHGRNIKYSQLKGRSHLLNWFDWAVCSVVPWSVRDTSVQLTTGLISVEWLPADLLAMVFLSNQRAESAPFSQISAVFSSLLSSSQALFKHHAFYPCNCFTQPWQHYHVFYIPCLLLTFTEGKFLLLFDFFLLHSPA